MKPRHAVPVLFATTACLWSALAGPAAGKTEVSIRGRNVTITVPIDAVGIDWGTAREWKRSAEAMWNEAFNADDNPFKGCINLKLELDIDIRGWSDAARPGRHMIFGSQGATTNQPAGTIAYNGNPYQSSADGNFDEVLGDGSHSTHVAHEVGHLLGLPDEYKVVSTSPRRTEPLDGRKNTLMADGGRIDPALLKRLVSRLRNETHNIPDCLRGAMNWTHVVANAQASATTTASADLSLESDGKGGLTGQIAGTHSTTSQAGSCFGSTTTPGGFQAKLVGSYAPGRDALTIRADDKQITPMHIQISCPGSKPVVSRHPGFYEHYERALTGLRATGDGGFESSHDLEYRCEAGSTCTTRITLKLRPPG